MRRFLAGSCIAPRGAAYRILAVIPSPAIRASSTSVLNQRCAIFTAPLTKLTRTVTAAPVTIGSTLLPFAFAVAVSHMCSNRAQNLDSCDTAQVRETGLISSASGPTS